MEWYGAIKKIIVLDFANEKEVMLFQCDWFDVHPAPSNIKSKSRGYSRDEYGIIDIDTTKFRYADEPYIMVNQAEQVCYMKSARKSKWSNVLRMKPRNLFAMQEKYVIEPSLSYCLRLIPSQSRISMTSLFWVILRYFPASWRAARPCGRCCAPTSWWAPRRCHRCCAPASWWAPRPCRRCCAPDSWWAPRPCRRFCASS